jgi:nucleotide-binding universal stress UspA family protein
MTVLDRIIVPLDGSELAEQIVPYAAELAAILEVPLALLHVVDPEGLQRPELHQEGHDVYLEQIVEHQEGWARAYLNALAKVYRREGVAVETQVTYGEPGHAIAQAAAGDGRTMVAMGTHGRTGIHRMVLGSVADRVLEAGASPLLLFRPSVGRTCPARTPRHIIVPLDGSAFGEEALPMAGYLGRALHAKVLLTRVATLQPAFVALPMMSDEGPMLYPELTPDVRGYLDERVHSLCLDHVDADSVLLEGEAGAQLVHLASTTKDSLIVTTTHGRSGIRRTVLGSVADQLVRGSGAPVLVLRGHD